MGGANTVAEEAGEGGHLPGEVRQRPVLPQWDGLVQLGRIRPAHHKEIHPLNYYFYLETFEKDKKKTIQLYHLCEFSNETNV